MTEIVQFVTTIILFLIDLFTLFLIGGIFYIIGLAIYTMASNRTPRWDSIFYVLVILMLAIWLVRWYPGQIISSVRTAMEESRPEADLLRTEVQHWLPGLDQIGPPATQSAAPVAPSQSAPAAPATPELVWATATATPETAVVVEPTPIPPTATPTPSPTPTIEATFDPHTWNPATPPPTPQIEGR